MWIFSVAKHDMGHGELLIRYTAPDGNIRVVNYSNFLEALASPGADTTVQLFEEGDYEVHLDYGILNSENIRDKTTYYKTSFKFKIRNGNCMVYIFDAKTNNELGDRAIAKNGFRIDTARSKYTNLKIKKEVLNGTTGSLDVRYDRDVSDGEEIKDEGVYTITASTKSNNESVSKTVYVGDDPVLSAYVRYNGKIEIYEIKSMLNKGYTITNDGELIEPVVTTTTEVTTTTTTTTTTTSTTESTTTTITTTLESTLTETEVSSASESATSVTMTAVIMTEAEEESNNKGYVFPIIGGIAGIAAVGGMLWFVKKKK